MRYLGGKYRIAARIGEHVDVIRAHARAHTYVEPFLGGGATFTINAPRFRRAVGADVVPDLIAMWSAARDGWTPPATLTDDEYAELRHAPPSAVRGFVGFGCSFGGRWFAGIARNDGNGSSRDKHGDPRNEIADASRRVVAQARAVPAAEYLCADYRTLDGIGPGVVVYADPPYAGTQGYEAAGGFDHSEFWQRAREWASAGAHVLVSEEAAPVDWPEVWAHTLPNYLSGQQRAGARTERLFADRATAELLAPDAGLFDLAPAG